MVITVLVTVASPQIRTQGAREGVTVTFLDAELAAPELLLRPNPALDEFTRQTGIRVIRVPGPEGSLNQLALWQESLRRNPATADVYTIDVIWPPMVAEHLADLRTLLAPEIARHDPAAVGAFTVEGKVVAIPYRPLVGVLLYRADLLRRYGYAAPPSRWDELEAMASTIQKGERARGERDFWGFVWQGAASEALTCNALEWQVAEGGGRIIEEDKTISVNNPQAIRAWERAARWVGAISPPGVIAYQEWDAHNVWSSGNAAFYRMWEADHLLRDWVGSAEDTIRGRRMGNRLGVTSVPGGRSGRAGTLGGLGLAVSRASAHRREALELVRFLTRRELALANSPRRTSGPDLPEMLDLPAILSPARHDARRARGSNDVVARPSIQAGPKYEPVTKAFIRAVHSVLTGRTSAPQAAAALEGELMTITGFHKGPPR